MCDIEQEMWAKKYVKQLLNIFFFDSSNKILFDLFVCFVGAAVEDLCATINTDSTIKPCISLNIQYQVTFRVQ